MQVHIVKNYLCELGMVDSHTRVPLILGIWGEKVRPNTAILG